MKIVSIEPTPSPNSMKINLDQKVEGGERGKTFTRENLGNCPSYIEQLLQIKDVKSVFQVLDFIAIEREAKGDWRQILAQVGEVFGSVSPITNVNSLPVNGEANSAGSQATPSVGQNPAVDPKLSDTFGEATVFVQMFRNIPMQIRVKTAMQEERVALPERFIQAMMRAQTAATNMILERKLTEWGVRYGDLKEIAAQIVQEIDATYDDERLNQLVAAALRNDNESAASPAAAPADDAANIEQLLHHPEWKRRYAALEKIKPTIALLPTLVKALEDENFSIRRLVVVYLGDLKEPAVFPYLYQALLHDKSASVRRTAGDCLSDIGDTDAILPMAKSLKDPSKIVRWRAARFLYEVGDESALPALREAAGDAEFEVNMQIQIAIRRIEDGEAASGSVWQQITRRNV